MENNNDLKSLYLTLFILGIIEAFFTVFFGYLVAIAVFVIALIIKSKLPKDQPVPTGIKLMIIASSIHIFVSFFNILFGIVIEFLFADIYMGEILFGIISFFSLPIMLAIFILLIIGCIKVHGEYKNLENIVS